MMCSIENCGRDVIARGYCTLHYQRWKHHNDPRREPQRTKELAPRFWAKVEKTDGCWNWTAAKNSTGYGWVGVNGGRKAAHRVSWEMHNGPITDGLHVLHRCDNRTCVRPSHLFLGTNADNVADKVAKGRAPGASQPGESHPHAKLTDAVVLEMRRLARAGVRHAAIAKMFGVRQQTASKAIGGTSWSHVPDPVAQRGVKFKDMADA